MTYTKWDKDNTQYYYNYWKENANKKKIEIIDHYTKGKFECMCKRCDVKGAPFLTVDHIKPVRRSTNKRKVGPYNLSYYTHIIKAGFPKTLQILCWNCNCTKGTNNNCAHYI